MITTPTVLVLGAGASAPFGFPPGSTLLNRVVEALGSDIKKRNQLVASGFSEGLITEFRIALSESAQPSIDAFLERRPKFVALGKAVIAQALIPFERHGELSNPSRQEKNWYRYLFQQMQVEKFDQFRENRLSVITFNYDRSFEHFLVTALSSAFEEDRGKCIEQVCAIPIVHVHGQLAPLPWQALRQSFCRDYEKKATPEIILKAADGIKVISEGDESSPEFEQARELLSEAMKIVFLGFGYHETNMKRLGIEDYLGPIKKLEVVQKRKPGVGEYLPPVGISEYVSHPRRVYGTAYGLKQMRLKEVQAAFSKANRGIHLGKEKEDCLAFLENNVPLK